MIHPFTLHPVIYWVGGAAVIAFAVQLYRDDLDDAADRSLALSQAQPEMVRLEGFDPNLNIGHDGEVTIRVQVDLDQIHEVTLERGFPPEKRWTAPLYATRAEEHEPVVGGVLLVRERKFDASRLTALSDNTGALGPVLTLDGRLVEPGPFQDGLDDALARDGVIASPDAIYVEPFLDGREIAFAPRTQGRDQAIALGVLGGLIILYGMVWRLIRRQFVR